jgi:hypothetical protein
VPAVRDVLDRSGLCDARFYLVDYSQHTLQPLASPGCRPLSVDTSTAGRAYRCMTRVEGTEHGRRRLWLPLLNHGSRLGVLGVELADGDLVSPALERRLADLVAMILVSIGDFTDQAPRARRAAPLELATEVRWDLLPSLTLMSGSLSIAGILEPAYEVAGDAFDYALNGDLAELAVLDAVGHGLEAARIVTLSTGAYRHLRREHAGLVETYRQIDKVLLDEFLAEKFVAAHLVELDVASGRLSWIAAGQPPPLLLRNGRTHDLPGAVSTPMGMGLALEPVTTTRTLEPGDMLLFFSDGVTEARSSGGHVLGRRLLADLFARCAQSNEPAPEMVRRLVHAVLDHVGAPLRDDATIVLLQWRPDRPRVGRAGSRDGRP